MNELNLNKATMSSLEIAELTGKLHKNVLRDIENVLNEVGIGALKYEASYLSSQNKQLRCYNLPRRECDLVVSGYVAKYRLAIIDRWQELENKNSFMPAAVPMLTLEESLELNLKQAKETRLLKDRIENLKIAGLQVVTELGSDQYFNVVAKVFSTNLGIDLGQNTFMEILRQTGYLQIGRTATEKNLPYQMHTDKFRVMLIRDEVTGAMKPRTVVKPEGINYLAPKITRMLYEYNNMKRVNSGLVPFPPFKDGE